MAYYRDVEDDIVRGLISGAKPIGSFGKKVTSGSILNQVIWGNGEFIVPPQTGFVPEVLSSSASDTAAGTGIRTLHIHYLDSEYNEADGYATLNGTSPVSVYDANGTQITDMRFVQCMHISTYGTGKKAAGNISLREVGDTIAYSYIVVGDTRCSSSARMVPAGKRLIVRMAIGSSTSTTADETTNIAIASTYFEGHDYTSDSIFVPYDNLGFRNNSFGIEMAVPLAFPEKTVIAMIASSDKAAIISGSWAGFLEPVTSNAT